MATSNNGNTQLEAILFDHHPLTDILFKRNKHHDIITFDYEERHIISMLNDTYGECHYFNDTISLVLLLGSLQDKVLAQFCSSTWNLESCSVWCGMTNDESNELFLLVGILW